MAIPVNNPVKDILEVQQQGMDIALPAEPLAKRQFPDPFGWALLAMGIGIIGVAGGIIGWLDHRDKKKDKGKGKGNLKRASLSKVSKRGSQSLARR